MHGVSEVIAIILILMITISLAGLAYMFMSTTMSDVTSSAGSTVDTTTSSMLTSFTIESMDIAKVYVRNTGQNALTSLSVYVNDEPATYNVTTPIAAGAVGTITIYSFIPDGATVKVTSTNGFSTSKVARPCENAMGCWGFDESSGDIAYDKSSYGNAGSIYSATRVGGKLSFDGINDYVTIGSNSMISETEGSIYILASFNSLSRDQTILISGNESSQVNNSNDKIFMSVTSAGFLLSGWTTNTEQDHVNISISATRWYDIVFSWSLSGNYVKLYVDGVPIAGDVFTSNNKNRWISNFVIGRSMSGATNTVPFNGTIDEVRIYNRAIY